MARLPQLRAWTLTGRSIRLATESTWLNPFSAYACPASSLILQVSMPTSPKAIQSWLAYASNSSMSSSPNDPGYSPRHGKAHPSVRAQIRRISSLLQLPRYDAVHDARGAGSTGYLEQILRKTFIVKMGMCIDHRYAKRNKSSNDCTRLSPKGRKSRPI